LRAGVVADRLPRLHTLARRNRPRDRSRAMKRAAVQWLAVVSFGFIAGAMLALIVHHKWPDCSTRPVPNIEIGGWLIAGCR
jgi:hypothetical protein